MPHSPSKTPPGALRLEGELDLYAAERVHAALVELLHGSAPAELDLSAVAGCDASGAQLLLSARATAAAQGRTLRFVAIPEPVHACFGRLGLPALS